MRFLSVVSLMFFLVTKAASAEKVGRVNSENAGIRCADEPLAQETCDVMRANAINRGCVSEDEHSLLVKYNLCPVCDWDFNGHKAYRGYCPPGCFSRGTRVLVRDLSDGLTRWETIEVVSANSKAFEVWSLDEGSTLSSQNLTARTIRMAVVGPEKIPLVVLSTADGAKLSVSSGHAMLLGSGEMVRAENLKIGDILAKYDGTKIEITDMERALTDDDVFNLLLDVDLPISHSIIAEGLITGDQYWQGALESLLGTIILNP